MSDLLSIDEINKHNEKIDRIIITSAIIGVVFAILLILCGRGIISSEVVNYISIGGLCLSALVLIISKLIIIKPNGKKVFEDFFSND